MIAHVVGALLAFAFTAAYPATALTLDASDGRRHRRDLARRGRMLERVREAYEQRGVTW